MKTSESSSTSTGGGCCSGKSKQNKQKSTMAVNKNAMKGKTDIFNGPI